MNVLGKLSAILFVIYFSNQILAQDIHFSQFYASPLNVTPANTGNFDGDFRAGLNYRRQWAAINPFKTLDVFYDMPVTYKNHRLSVGGLIINDRTNNNNMNVSKLYLSGAYHKLYKRHYFHGGIQAGVALHSASEDMVLQDQYNPGTTQFDLASQEAINTHPFHVDVNAGIGWNHSWEKFAPAVSYSLYHLNQPKQAFISEESQLKAKHVFYAQADWYALEKIYFTPRIIYMTSSGAADAYFGTNLTYVLLKELKEKSIFGGLYLKNEFKNFDAMVLVLGVNWFEWQGAISYDLNVSSLNVATNYRGAIEISLIYTDFSSKLKSFTIPCERF